MKKITFLFFLILLFALSNCEKKESVHEGHNHDHEVEKSSNQHEHKTEHSTHALEESEHLHDENCEHAENHSKHDIPEGHEHEMSHDDHEHSENLVHFPHELAEKIDFKIKTIQPECFQRSIHTSGEFQIIPAESRIINAAADGIINFKLSRLAEGTIVKKGQHLFTISGKTMPRNSIELEYQTASDNYSASKKNFLRAKVLVSESIISEKEFLDVKNRYRQDSLAFSILKKNYTSKGLNIKSPVNGYIAEILVSNGDFVESGTPLVRIHNKEKALIKVDFPTEYYRSVQQITEGSFKVTNCRRTWRLNELNGKLHTIAGEIVHGSPFLPVYYEIDMQPEFIPGGFAEIWLNLSAEENCIVLPKSAIIEQQGTFYVFVEKEHEYYEKRRIYIQNQSGKFIQVKSGLKCGEEVIVRGAMDVKLASMSSGISEHHHH